MSLDREQERVARNKRTPAGRRAQRRQKLRNRFAGRYEEELASTEEKAAMLREIIAERA